MGDCPLFPSMAGVLRKGCLADVSITMEVVNNLGIDKNLTKPPLIIFAR